MFSLHKLSGSIAFSPPSFEVRNVIRIGIFPRASRRSFNTSSTLQTRIHPRTSLHAILQRQQGSNVKCFCFCDDIVFCNAYDRNDDFRCAGTDFNISNFYCIHDVFPFFSSILTLCITYAGFSFSRPDSLVLRTNP